MALSPEQLREAVGCSAADAIRFAAPISEACRLFGINTNPRLAAFLAQVGHESGSFARTVENLNYSAQRLAEVWPTRYAKDPRARQKEPNGTAIHHARKPEVIANHVYAGRLGNGNADSGDGWRYRGRGLIQVTGKSNYRGVTAQLASLGAPDFVAQPEMLESPRWAALSAGAWWDDHELNIVADTGDIRRMTRIVNGGLNGLADRQSRYAIALASLPPNFENVIGGSSSTEESL